MGFGNCPKDKQADSGPNLDQKGWEGEKRGEGEEGDRRGNRKESPHPPLFPWSQ